MQGVVKALNTYLANLGVLDIKLHNLHWNVEGQNFFSLHAKLEEFYDLAGEDLDEVAERILTLGYRPLASLKDFMASATLSELPSKAVKGPEVVDIVEGDFNAMLKQSREILTLAEEAKDQGTVDLMAGFIGRYEKTLWMLRAYKA
ncbi:hypothetical protein DC28_08360 [Spirochaeta lutea]|uniref:Ferritin/DPS domain-containing protein n=1 Tax=Spirochaeta lutea TaxID=1480694 RepID=A0A098QWD4_9SPIO|nr:hypothetical protein DC28_08360 [Spirochaeta lutea]